MTGLLSSERPSVSIRPACCAPVENSDATRRHLNTVSKFFSTSCCRSFSEVNFDCATGCRVVFETVNNGMCVQSNLANVPNEPHASATGRICYRSRKINLSQVFGGQD